MGMAVVHGEKTFYLQIQLLRNCCKSQFRELLENLPIVETCAHTGPKLPKDQLIIAVNWTGVYMVDDQEQVIKFVFHLKPSFIFKAHGLIHQMFQSSRFFWSSPSLKSPRWSPLTQAASLTRRSPSPPSSWRTSPSSAPTLRTSGTWSTSSSKG